MSTKTRFSDLLVAWGGGLLLLFFHLDFWRPRRPILYCGWIPEELAYRLLWIAAAWAYLIFFTHRIWTEEGQSEADEDRPS